jgi:hypothetical protein
MQRRKIMDNRRRSTWWNDTVKIVPVPKEPFLTLPKQVERTLLATAKEHKAFAIPDKLFSRVSFVYGLAKQHGLQLRRSRQGDQIVMWADRPNGNGSKGHAGKHSKGS